MEKKTIGMFIAALRRAHGMTQRELAERCNVSDKAISRWERDECAPDLTLLPVLAEIFGITVDELLRGERKTAESTETEYQKEKTEKQMRHLLRKKELGFRDRSWIMKGIAMGGLLAAIIGNALHEGLVGFFVGLAFFIAAAIAGVCFWNHAVSGLEEFDDSMLTAYKAGIVGTCRNSYLLTLLLFAATIPLVTLDRFWGMDMATWLFFWAPIMAAIMLGICVILWRFVIAKRIEKRGYPASVKPWTKAGKKLLRRLVTCVGVFGIIAGILLSVAVWTSDRHLHFAEKIYFDTVEEFIAYMEDDSQNIENREDVIVFPPYTFGPGDTYMYEDVVIGEGETNETEFVKHKKAYLLINGKMKTFYWNNSNVYTYNYGNQENGAMFVITHDGLYAGYDKVNAILNVLLAALVADITVGASLCLVSIARYVKEKKRK
ncbi:MAG: helix-turn-helix transcriptional regulator [Clostridia bacterium]|nr:helix-turn-helix transcriptional regulator [Clostridia bacterium]